MHPAAIQLPVRGRPDAVATLSIIGGRLVHRIDAIDGPQHHETVCTMPQLAALLNAAGLGDRLAEADPLALPETTCAALIGDPCG